MLLQSTLVWSAQVALLVSAGWLVSLTIEHPKTRLAMWQGLLLMVLFLPLIEPWTAPAAVSLADVTTEAGSTADVLTATPPASFHWRPEYWLYLITAGAAIRMVLLAVGFVRLRRYRKQAEPLPGPPLRFASTVASWYASDAVSGPVTYGWRRPVILIPTSVMELPEELSEAIQCHELIHVRRGDWLWVLGETMVRTVLWFHPGIWFLVNRIQLAREQAVDREAVNLLQNRERYLDALVAVAQLHVKPGRLSTELAPAFLRKRHLVARVKAVAKEIPMSRSRIVAGIAAASSVLSVAALGAMWMFPFTSAPVSEAQTAPDSVGVTVEAGAPLLHRAPVRVPQGVTGTVIVQATIDAKGEVSDARVLSGPDELRKAVLTSVLQWHYAPGPSTAQVSIQVQSAAPVTTATQTPPVFTPVPSIRQSVPLTGGRGGAAATPPAAPAFPAQVKSLQFQGLSSEAEQQLRSRLTVREGDTVTQDDVTTFNDAVRAFDDHLLTITSHPEQGQVALTVRVLPDSAPPPPAGPAVQPGQGQVRVSADVQSTKIISAPKPAYPPIAKQARIQGSVVLNAVIGKDGTMKQLVVSSSSNPLLTPAAVDAVKQWVYQPTTLNGETVEVVTQITVNFTLL